MTTSGICAKARTRASISAQSGAPMGSEPRAAVVCSQQFPDGRVRCCASLEHVAEIESHAGSAAAA